MINDTTVGMLIPNSNLSYLLSMLGTMIPSDQENAEYYYLPFWFKRDIHDRITAYHFNDLPTELKQLIDKNREAINEQIQQP